MNIIKLKLTGTRPLLNACGYLCRPAKSIDQGAQITDGKRKKTDEDHELIDVLKWRGGLYYDDEWPLYARHQHRITSSRRQIIQARRHK